MRRFARALVMTAMTALGAVALGPAQAAECFDGVTLKQIDDGIFGSSLMRTCSFGLMTIRLPYDAPELAGQGPLQDDGKRSEPFLTFSASGNTHSVTWAGLDFTGDPLVGVVFGYEVGTRLPYAVSSVVTQTIVQTPVAPAGESGVSSKFGSFGSGVQMDVSAFWTPPTEIVYDEDGLPVEVTFLARLNSITHTFSLECASSGSVQCTFPPPDEMPPVPEPSTWLLFAAGSGLLLLRRRR